MIREFVRGALISVAVAITAFAALVAAALWAPQDQKAIRQHLVDSIASGVLNDQSAYGPFAKAPLPTYVFNCLLFGTMVAPAGGAWLTR